MSFWTDRKLTATGKENLLNVPTLAIIRTDKPFEIFIEDN